MADTKSKVFDTPGTAAGGAASVAEAVKRVADAAVAEIAKVSAPLADCGVRES